VLFSPDTGTLTSSYTTLTMFDMPQKTEPCELCVLLRRVVRRSMMFLCALLIVVVVGGWTSCAAGHADDGRGRVIVPFGFYSPETRAGMGAVGIFYRKTEGAGSSSARDVLQFMVFHTQEGQSLTACLVDAYPYAARAKVSLAMALSKFPDKFFGIGPHTTAAAEESFTPFRYFFTAGLQAAVADGLYLGPMVVCRHYDLRTYDEGGAIEAFARGAGEAHRLIGAGAMLTRDTRDNVFYPTRGSYLEATTVHYGRTTGSDADYAHSAVEARSFVSIVPGHIIGIQVVAEYVGGDPPFFVLPELGGRGRLRGIYGGRFRDQAHLSAQAEYRFPLAGRFRGAAFFGAAQVAEGVRRLSADDPKVAGGVGIRFAADPAKELNFRFDIAFNDLGPDDDRRGVYFSLTEAF